MGKQTTAGGEGGRKKGAVKTASPNGERPAQTGPLLKGFGRADNWAKSENREAREKRAKTGSA